MSDDPLPDMADFEYTLTRRALRQLKAEAWRAGLAAGHECVGAEARPDCIEKNPYKDDS